MMALDYSLASLIMASIIAVITLTGIIWTNRRTKNSNELLKREINSKLRPFFTLDWFHITPKKDEALIFRTKLKNYGNVPARKITMWCKKTGSDNLVELCKEKDKLNSSRSFGTLQHNGEYRFEEMVERNGNDVKFLIWFKYQYFEKTEESAVLCRINPNDLDNVKQEWFIQEDIDEARKEWNDIKSGKRSADT